MKEPWEIFTGELVREAKRRGSRTLEGKLALPDAEKAAAFDAAMDAVWYHLVDSMRWRAEEADSLIEHFWKAIQGKSTDQSIETALRRAWEQWQERNKPGGARR